MRGRNGQRWPGRRRAALVASFVLALLLAGPAPAAQVRVEVSAGETYVGMPVVLSIIIEDSREEQKPELPPIANASVQELWPPSRQSSTTIVNGRMTRKTSVTYQYRITPEQPGAVRIPAFVVEADGQKFQSEPIEIVVSRSESGDLLFVELEASRQTVYLGQPLDLTLRVWIKPFLDRRLRLRLDDGDMWSLVDRELSAWGPFAERLEELARQRRRPPGREERRKDRAGEERSYFLYELKTRVWPETAGPLDLGAVGVAMAYPVRLERERSLLSLSNLRVAEARPVRVEAVAPVVTVEPAPAEGRPEWFNGAVGRFGVVATARPVEVAVGEPITLTIEVNDLTPGGSRLELLPPPPLQRLDELTARFRIPSDPLAGTVSGRTKVFTQTVRPIDDSVERIPAIPFSFFDPLTRSFQTVWSDPIDVTVHRAASMAMTDVVGGGAEERPTELTEVAGGLLANYVEPAVVLRNQRVEAGWWLALLVGLPPVLTAGTLVAQRRHRRLRDDRGYTRQRRARRRALGRLATAAEASSEERLEMLGDTLSGYVADRCNLPAGAVTSTAVVEALRSSGADESITGEVERLLTSCEAARYAGLEEANGEDLVRETRSLIDRLERERIS